MPRWRRGRSVLLLLRRAFILAALSAATLFLLLHHQGPKPPKASSSFPAALAFTDEFSVEPPPTSAFSDELYVESRPAAVGLEEAAVGGGGGATCATVERMGEEAVSWGSTEAASLRVRELIQRHFLLHGAARVRSLPAFEFCKHGFVLGKASEAGFGNEMYKILTAAALECHVKPVPDHRANQAYAFTLS